MLFHSRQSGNDNESIRRDGRELTVWINRAALRAGTLLIKRTGWRSIRPSTVHTSLSLLHLCLTDAVIQCPCKSMFMYHSAARTVFVKTGSRQSRKVTKIIKESKSIYSTNSFVFSCPKPRSLNYTKVLWNF